MNRQSLSLTLLLSFLILAGCQDAPSGSDQTDAPATYSDTAPLTDTKPAPSTIAEPAIKKNAPSTLEELASDDPFVISGGSVLGIRPGDAIASVNNAKKTTMKTGDGDFTVYNLMDEGGKKIGYLLPDPNDMKKIRSIHITSDMLTTPEGISVGTTFAELEKMVGSVRVNGSELEGLTYATAGKLKFRLKAANFSYEVDKTKIKPSTKITEIVVN